jgi:putative ABC transport system permease protein
MAVWADLRYSARSLTRTPGLALTLLLSVALGIGSNASVVGFVRGLVQRDLPISGIDRIVSLFARDAQDGFGPLSYESYLSLEAHREVFASLGAARESRGSIVLGGRASVMSVAAVTPELADLLQLSLSKGIVISHRVWEEEFGAKAEVRGELIRIDGVQSRVASVAPEWLDGLYVGSAVDIWMPLLKASPQGIDRSSRTFWALGRLRPSVSPAQAQAAVNATRSGADAIAVLPYTGMTPDVAGGMVRIGALLSAAAGAVFFIACANAATFLLSRASARSRETAVRVALGAGRGRLLTQLLSDSVLISVAGGAFGMLFAVWTAHLVPALFFEQDAEQLVFVPDLRGIVTASVACAAITVACGLIPLFEIRHDNPATVLQREGAGPSKAMRRLRAGLVVAQMTCCCVLVISTGLLLESFRAALQTRVGHRLEPLLLATLQARQGFNRSDLGVEYFRNAERAVQSLADVSATAWAGTTPGGRPVWQSMRIEPLQPGLQDVVMDVAAFTPQSFALVTLPPIAGRMFGGGDTPQTCRVAIVNEEAANDLFHGDAVGRSIRDAAGQRVDIIGVVVTRKVSEATPNRPTIYYYAEQTGMPLDRVGPARFRVPLQLEPSHGVLDVNVVSSGYFDAMGLRPIAGKLFPDDPAPRGCRVAVINQEAAERYFGGNAVGGAVIDGAGRRTEIVGVVHSALQRTSQRRAEPAIYFPLAQDFLPRMTLILRVREANEATVTSVRRRFDVVSGGAGGAVVTTLDAHLSRTALAPERIAMVLVGASAATALTLGVLGLYGVMSDAARQRRREFAVRIALGAQRWRVISQVLAEGIRLAGAGTIAGMLGSLVVSRWLARMAPGAGSPTVWVWLAAPLVLAGAVAIAGLLPARRALAVDPLAIIREE